MRIAHFGTFDVENYGDLLFPLLLERRLSDVCEEFVHVSPTGGKPPWGDCVPTVGFDEFVEEGPKVDGVVLGGGQILRATSTPLEIYDRGGVSPFVAYPSLWLGDAYVAARDNIPLCWNAPGVAAPFSPVAAQLAAWAASVTDYPTVRDRNSQRILAEAGVGQDVGVVPDTAVEVCRLWTAAEISEAYTEAFASRDRETPERSLVFHVNSRYVSEGIPDVAARIERICARFDASAILVATGPCHGDDELQRQVAQEMEGEPLLIDRPSSLREITACIARSVGYFGSSLHGMITACSFGRPGVLVASRRNAKFEGFLEHFDLSSRLVESWSGAEELAGELPPPSLDEGRSPVLEASDPALEEHWERVRSALTTGPTCTADKPPAISRLHEIGEDNYGELEVFGGLIAESLEDREAKLRKAREKLEQAELQLRELTGWMEELSADVSALQGSRIWKVGQLLAGIYRRITRRPRGPTALDHASATLESYHKWRGRQKSGDLSRKDK